MLDVITDFWKPSKKAQAQPEKLDIEGLRPGSQIGFGYVPQTNLSGRRLTVSAINTYAFGDERLTSFLLEQEGDAGVSLIVAESEGEKYLALSRRIPFSERMKLIDTAALEAVVEKEDIVTLSMREPEANWKHWVVGQYKKDIHALKGRLYAGDFREFAAIPDHVTPQAFDYYLLVSDSNEYGLEIEKYADGRLEVFATIYRRIADIGQISHPREDVKAPVAAGQAAASAPAPETIALQDLTSPAEASDTPEPTPAPAPPAVTEPPAVPPAPAVTEPPMKAAANDAAPVAEKKEAAPQTQTQVSPPVAPPAPALSPARNTTLNGSVSGLTPAVNLVSPKPAALVTSSPNSRSITHQEAKTVSTAPIQAENDAVECDLRVANKIIEEAIRNEMRLSDIVRRIIALPVAYPEAVQIPVTLSDNDYQLLAIRYGMQASEKEAIKRRIIEELNDFSSPKKQ